MAFDDEQANAFVDRWQVASLNMDLATFGHLTFSPVWMKILPPPSGSTLFESGTSLISGPLLSKLMVGVYWSHSPFGSLPNTGASYSSENGGINAQFG